MKKIIAITAMAAMVAAAAMADEPVAELGLAIEGSDTLTWGVDLDEGDTGFKNESSAKVTVTFAKGGSKTSEEGEGVWAEVAAKLDGDIKYKLDGDGSESFVKDGGKAVLDVAKIHIGDLYIGLKKGDITVGEFKVPNAVRSEQFQTKNLGGEESHGLVVGYGTDDFGIDVDFRSLPDGEDYLTNHYGLAAEAQLKDSNAFVPGLFAKAGVSYAFGSDHQFNESKQLAFGVQAAYKLSLGDTYYLKPGVGFVGSKTGDADMVTGLAGGVLFGWGDQADANAGVYYLDSDPAKKVTPGVGVAVLLPNLTADTKQIYIQPSFYSGDIVPGLKAAVLGEILMSTADGVDPEIGVAGGVSYELAVGDSIKVTPKAGFRFATTNASTSDLTEVFTRSSGKDLGNYDDNANADTTSDANAKGLLNVKAGVDISGLINNTTFGAYYQSRNLRALKDDGKAGTFNVFVKVSI